MPRSTIDLASSVNWKDFWRPVKDKAPDRGQFTIITYGPEHLGARADPAIEYGPAAFTAENPQLFDTGPTSEPEGWLYWAFLELRGPAGQEGGWQYQRKVRPGGQKVGAATVDFVIEAVPKPIACRLVTPWFHLAGGPEKEASDEEQLFMLEEQGYTVMDAFSELFMKDPSGLAVKNIAQRVIELDPILAPGSATYYGR